MSAPLAYFITFHTYGTWLHGREMGSVDDDANLPGAPVLPAIPTLEASSRRSMTETPYRLSSETARRAVLEVVREVCRHRGWFLHAAHVRTTHVHLVLTGDAAPEKMLNDFKAYATRRLKSFDGEPDRRHRWSHYGSTRYLWDANRVAGAVRYTLDEQGVPMATYIWSDDVGSSEPGA